MSSSWLLLDTAAGNEVVGLNPEDLTTKTLLLDWDTPNFDDDIDGRARWGNDDSEIDYTQATGENKPDLTAFSIRGDGVNDFMQGPTLANLRGTEYSTVWAVEFVSIGTDDPGLGNEGWFEGGAATLALMGRSSNQIGMGHFTAGGTVTLYQSVASTVGKHIVGVIWDGSTAFLRVDDNSFTSVAMGAPTAGTMSRIFRNGAARLFDGHIGHAVWTSDEKSQGDIGAVMDFYNDKWSSY